MLIVIFSDESLDHVVDRQSPPSDFAVPSFANDDSSLVPHASIFSQVVSLILG